MNALGLDGNQFQRWLSSLVDRWARTQETMVTRSFQMDSARRPTVAAAKPEAGKPDLGFEAALLRRIKEFASLRDPQLEELVSYLEVVHCPQFSHIVRRGDYEDAVYIILEGEVRAFTIVEGKETTLNTMSSGDCFGEIALLTQGPRTVDVIANRDSVLLKLRSREFDRLFHEAPALAAPFLLAMNRALVGHIKGITTRYEDSIRFIRTSGTMR